MRLPADGRTFSRRLIATIALPLALAGCGGAPELALPAVSANGPRADYPVTIGEPYTVAGVSYRPEDVLNYDEVGYLTADPAASGVTASHHTLPLPSYVEVTSLETGRTIAVRVERRGPMDGNQLIALSPAALAQLGAAEGQAVRVRRINPPEEHRALLRAGGEAPPRMDTPMPLVEVLRRKLPEQRLVWATATGEAEVEVSAAPQPLPPLETPAATRVAADGAFLVQAASFSTEQRAKNAAEALGGTVTPSGKYFRVRTGPFATRAEAQASLAKVRAAGYSDARILTSG